MTSTQTLPRKVDLSPGVWPARTILRITSHTTCRHCATQVAYFHGVNLDGQWAHVETERTRCATELFSIADPLTSCPKCLGYDLVTDHTDPYADHTRCPCGWSERRSLGD